MSLSKSFTKKVRAGPFKHCPKSNLRDGVIADRLGGHASAPLPLPRHKPFVLPLAIVLALGAVMLFFGCSREGSQHYVKWKGQDSTFENETVESTNHE
jgi:hypothetical protein